ncbi:MAG: DUF3348 domain-containing protein [Pseudomonadales bacterium]|nr:DUF3348 domain-containing protein [Pseudomonadales bacterium]
MTQAPASRMSPSRVRLLQLLADAGAPVGDDRLPCLSERLGRLFGLGDTMNLEAALGFRGRPGGLGGTATLERLCQELARIRRTLTAKIQQYGDDADHSAPAFAPLQEAYLARQRELAAASRQFRSKVRSALAEQGPALGKLCELDAVFDHTLAAFTSQGFANIPRVLEQRFQALQTSATEAPATDAGGWFHQYCEEAQGLLLAELDVRLEPALGLLEAFHNEVSNTP